MFGWVALLSVAAPLRLEEAVELAVARAPEVAMALAERSVAEARRDQADSAYLPRLEMSATYFAKTYKNIIEPPSLPAGIQVVFDEVDDYQHFQGQLKVGWRAIDFSRSHRVDAANHKARAQDAKVAEVRTGLAFRTRATFFAALFSKDVLTLSEQSLSVAEKDLRRAELNAEVGNGSALAVAQVRIRVASLRAQAAKAKNELLRHTEQLALLTGRNGPIEPEGDLASYSDGAVPEGATHPQLLRLELSALALESVAESHRMTLIPSLTLFATADLQYPRGLKVELGEFASVGAQLSWPIFDGFLREASASEAQARAAQARAGRSAAEDELVRKRVDLDARARTARAEKEGAETRVTESELYLKVAKAAVEAGTGTDLEVRTAELGLDQAKLSVRQAVFELALVRAERLFVLGLEGENRR
ncbi:MAG: TolC family protein [Deltaproteobacteria bacterium]|nr:TolC family protein [Deltaproteobacteria bacterium]